MSVYSIYFSPTGGTRKVMGLLTSGWQKPVEEIDLSDGGLRFCDMTFYKEDVCFIGVPSFGGRVPSVALKRLASIKADGTAAVLVVTYGNRAFEDTLLELQETANACGFDVQAAVAAVTEHSIMHRYGEGRPDGQDAGELEEYAGRIRETICMGGTMRQGKAPSELYLPGNRPYKEYKGVPLKPKADTSCTGCKACANLCPVGAISPDAPMETDAGSCISCMRCIEVCPRKARTLNKAMLFAAEQSLRKACSERKKNELFLSEVKG